MHRKHFYVHNLTVINAGINYMFSFNGTFFKNLKLTFFNVLNSKFIILIITFYSFSISAQTLDECFSNYTQAIPICLVLPKSFINSYIQHKQYNYIYNITVLPLVFEKFFQDFLNFFQVF